MNNVIDYWEWRRARLGSREVPPVLSPRPSRSRRTDNSSFVRIADVSREIVRKLTE
jgi:hypothetical protein